MVVDESDFKKLERKQSFLAKLCIALTLITLITVVLGGIAFKRANDAATDLAATKATTAAKLARVASGVTAQNTLRIYESGVREHNDCLNSVENSLNNRGQHQAVVDSQQVEREAFLVAFPNGVDFINESFDQMRAALQNGPLLASEPRSIDECPPLPKPIDPAIVKLANSIMEEAETALEESEDSENVGNTSSTP